VVWSCVIILSFLPSFGRFQVKANFPSYPYRELLLISFIDRGRVSMVKISPSYECLLFFLLKKRPPRLPSFPNTSTNHHSTDPAPQPPNSQTTYPPRTPTHPATSPILALQYTHCPTVTRLHHLPPLSPLIPVNHSSHPVHLTTILAATYQAAK
jgi:hypothetical protein